MDGVGEWATTSVAIGAGKDLTIHKEIHFPDSLVLLDSAFTYYTGFKVNSGEYKSWARSLRRTQIQNRDFGNSIDVKPDGSFRLNLDYFSYCTGLTMTGPRFDALFGGPRAAPISLSISATWTAASIQAVTDEVILRLAQGSLASQRGCKIFVLPGGSL